MSQIYKGAVDRIGNAIDSAERTFLDRVEGYVERTLTQAGGKVAASLKDPDMPLAVQSAVDVTIEQLWPDVTEEVMESVHENMLHMSHTRKDYSYLEPKVRSHSHCLHFKS